MRLDEPRGMYPKSASHLRKMTVLFLLSVILFSPAAKSASWDLGDFRKYIDYAVWLTVDKVHGGMAMAKGAKPLGGRLPLVDLYSALDASGSSVKPGLTLWLQAKMRAAADAGDTARYNAYQAYYTALAADDPYPLRKLQREAEKAERDRNKRKPQATPSKPPEQALILNAVQASISGKGSLRVTPQFTIKGNEKRQVKTVSYRGRVTGPDTFFRVQGTLPARLAQGYQAGEFFTRMPEGSPTGTYAVKLFLSDSRGLVSSTKARNFRYVSKTPIPPDLPPELPPKDPPVAPPDIDPNHSQPPSSGPFKVAISGPRQAKTADILTFSPVLSGEPVEPVDYTWYVNGKTVHKRSVTGRIKKPGQHNVRLVAKDSAGRRVTANLAVIVEKSQLRVQVAGPSKTPVGRVVNLTSRVVGGTPPYTYHWETYGKTWSTESVTLDYDAPGRYSAKLLVKDSKGIEGSGSLEIQVSDGIAINVAGPRDLSVGQSGTYTPILIRGPKSGYTYKWQVGGQRGSGPSFSPKFTQPGKLTLWMSAKHPEHPVYRAKSYIEVVDPDDPQHLVGGPLRVQISGPTTTKIGKKVGFRPKISGGKPPYSYIWTVKGRRLRKKSVRGKFETTGVKRVLLEVYDSGEHSSRPVQASMNLSVGGKSTSARPSGQDPKKIPATMRSFAGTYTYWYDGHRESSVFRFTADGRYTKVYDSGKPDWKSYSIRNGVLRLWGKSGPMYRSGKYFHWTYTRNGETHRIMFSPAKQQRLQILPATGP